MSISCITRRLVTLASLGLAGLITGCSHSHSKAVGTSSPAAITWEFTPSTTPSAPGPISYDSIDARQIPSLHHPPSARRLQPGSIPTFNAVPATNSPHSS